RDRSRRPVLSRAVGFSAAWRLSRLMANLAARTLLAGRPHGSGPRQSLVNRSPTGGRHRSRADPASPRANETTGTRIAIPTCGDAGSQQLGASTLSGANRSSVNAMFAVLNGSSPALWTGSWEAFAPETCRGP